MCGSGPRLHEKYRRELRNFDTIVWQHEREYFVLDDSCANLAETPDVVYHLLGTDDGLVADVVTYGLI